MREQRWPWLLTAALILASAVAAAWSTYLYWLPCRGTMLEGTIIQPFSGDGGTYEEYERLDPAVKASMDACLRRMDGDISEQAPWTSELLVLAMALVGLAWLTLVFCLRWQLRTKAVAALPGLATVVMALAVAATIGEGERGEDHPLHTMLPVAVEWSALFALAMIWVWQPEVRTRRRFLRLALALWGTTAFGIYHQMLLYMIMVGFSERDWDEPPGTGYLTVAAITISAILIVIMTLRMPQGADDEPHQDHRSRLYDAAYLSRSLAAGRARVPSMTTKQLIIGVAIALGVCLLFFAFRYTPPTSTPIPAPSKTWSPEQAGWPYPSPIAWEKYRPYLQEEIDTAGMAKDCRKLEKLFQEVANLPDADELMTYVDRWGVHTDCIDDEE